MLIKVVQFWLKATLLIFCVKHLSNVNHCRLAMILYQSNYKVTLPFTIKLKDISIYTSVYALKDLILLK